MSILLLVAPGQVENCYGPYAGEILRTEGYNQVCTLSVDDLQTTALSGWDLLVLTPCRLLPAQVDVLGDYVAEGGRLIAIRPSKPLLLSLGMDTGLSATVDGYVALAADHPLGGSLTQESIQFHGVAEHLCLVKESEGWEVAAYLGASASDILSYPALVVKTHGQGQVAILAYDIGETIASLRQGDPRLANFSMSSADGRFRPAHLFLGHTDSEKAHIPQADVHANVLSNLVRWMSPRPLPRLWYYPRPEQRSALVMTSDDDWSKLKEFEALMEALEALDGHITFFLMEDTAVTSEHVQRWSERGHSFGVHPYIREPHAGCAEARACVVEHVNSFVDRFGFRPITTRNHCGQWVDYLGEMQILLEQGIGMEFNYMSGSEWPVSFMTGSGRPMKAVELDGRILEIFQQPSHFSEDGLLTPSIAPSNIGWTTEEAIERVARVIDEAVDRYYTSLCINSHPRSFVRYSGEFVSAVLSHARQRGVPIPSSDEWLHFTRARHDATISEPSWQGNRLSFRLELVHPTEQLTVMIPLQEGWGKAILTVDGQAAEAKVADIFGFSFLMLPLEFGDVRSRTVSVHFSED